jgi:hypothetical protein
MNPEYVPELDDELTVTMTREEAVVTRHVLRQHLQIFAGSQPNVYDVMLITGACHKVTAALKAPPATEVHPQ